MFKIKLHISFYILSTLLVSVSGFSQRITVSGTVYDITKKKPIEFVRVVTTSGKGTMNDSLGKYTLAINESDSIFFSYLNKPTPKYSVKSIQNPEAFDISIMRKVKELPEVFVKQINYSFD